MFNEITANAIKKAFEKPGSVNLHLVDAQQARRILDRLVGYKISPLLWDKVRRGLSAGRVQTVALRLIVDREREIRAFIKREYWTIDVSSTPRSRRCSRRASPRRTTKPSSCRRSVPRACWISWTARSIWSIRSRTREKKRNPGAAVHYLHAAAGSSRKLRFSVKRTMMLAQRLYEGVELARKARWV
jgi:DNA topoisomerase-1